MPVCVCVCVSSASLANGFRVVVDEISASLFFFFSITIAMKTFGQFGQQCLCVQYELIIAACRSFSLSSLFSLACVHNVNKSFVSSADVSECCC